MGTYYPLPFEINDVIMLFLCSKSFTTQIYRGLCRSHSHATVQIDARSFSSSLTVLATADVGEILVLFKGEVIGPRLHGVALRGTHVPALVVVTETNNSMAYHCVRVTNYMISYQTRINSDAICERSAGVIALHT